MMQQHKEFQSQLQHASSTQKTKQSQQSPQTQHINQHPPPPTNMIAQSHLRKLANAAIQFKAMGNTGGLTPSQQAQMAMAQKKIGKSHKDNNMLSGYQVAVPDEGPQSQSYRQLSQHSQGNTLMEGTSSQDFCAQNVSNSTKTIQTVQVIKKPPGNNIQNQNVTLGSGRRITSNEESVQNMSSNKKKPLNTQQQTQHLSGGMSLKIAKKQGLTLTNAVAKGSQGIPAIKHAGTTKSTVNNNVIRSSGQLREQSCHSDNAQYTQNNGGLNNSLLKQKSRNRCNENLNIGAGPGSGVAVGAQAAESQGSNGRINNNNDSNYQGNQKILSSAPGSGLLQPSLSNLTQEFSSHKELIQSSGSLGVPVVSQQQSVIKGPLVRNNKNSHEKDLDDMKNLKQNAQGIQQKSISKNSIEKVYQLSATQPLNFVSKPMQKELNTLSLDRAAVQQNILSNTGNFQGIQSTNLDTSLGNIGTIIPKKKIILQNPVQSHASNAKNILFKQVTSDQQKNSTPSYQASLSNTNGGLTQSLEKIISVRADNLSLDESSISNRNEIQKYEKSPTINQKSRHISRIAQTKNALKQGNQNENASQLNVGHTEMHVMMPQSERTAYLGTAMSLSHEYANSARDCEMSTTINYTNTNVPAEEVLACQTMMVQSQSPRDDGSACSPQNQSTGKINFYPASKNSSGAIIKRRTPVSSQHFVSQLAPSQAKRRHQLNTGSCHQRVTSDEAGTSSPSGAAANQNNISSSQGNKSQHYGLSSQSFLTNSNSNGGSNTRIPAVNQGPESHSSQVIHHGHSSSCYNNSAHSNSFINHQRQKSGGGFTTALSNIKTSTKKTNSSLQPQVDGAQKITISTIQATNLIFRGVNQKATSKKAILAQHDTDMKANQFKHQPNLSQTMIEVPEVVSMSSRPAYQQTITTSGTVMLKDKSKTGLKHDETRSRSNSIKKKVSNVQKQNSKKSLQQNNYFIQEQNPPFDNEKNLHVYNHTVEDMDNSLNHSMLQQSFSKEATQTKAKGKGVKKDYIGLNRSVVVEPSNMMNNSLIKQSKKKQEALAKNIQQEHEAFEIMKNELKSKDMMIQNLRDRLIDLEEKVNGIQQQTQQRNNRGRNQEDSEEISQSARDKSQQRIKEAIMKLEMKLEQFRLEKEFNNQRLEELKQYSSSQHSSSRQSELLKGQKSLQTQQQYLQTMLEAGFIPAGVAPFALAQGRTPQYNIPSSSSEGFTSHTLGPQHRRKNSRTSLIEDLESLITIAENEEALAALGTGSNLAALQNQIFFDQKQGLLSVENQPRIKNFGKIKTPMFEEDIGQICLSQEPDDSHLKIIAQGGELIIDEDGEAHDNSCLMMLEKEWQEAQKQKLRDEGHQNLILTGSGGHKNISNLFDQSLISSSNNAMVQQLQKNNQTQNNIVMFLDDDTLQHDPEIDEDDIEKYVEPIDDIVQAAKGGKEKFVKTQKIEFTMKERASLHLGGKAQGDSSLSPSSQRGILVIPTKKLKLQQINHDAKDSKKASGGSPTFSRTLSKTQLIEKIRNAFGKPGPDNNVPEIKESSNSKVKQVTLGPRRFIIKRSQERNGSTSQGATGQQVKLKTQVTVQNSGRPVQENQELDQNRSAMKQQEQLMKSIVEQKEKIAMTQKDALKKERELSLKLRQAIQKMNLKIHQNALSSTAAGVSIKKRPQ